MYLYLGRYSPPEMGTFAVSGAHAGAILLRDLASNAFFSKGGEKSKKSETFTLHQPRGGRAQCGKWGIEPGIRTESSNLQKLRRERGGSGYELGGETP